MNAECEASQWLLKERDSKYLWVHIKVSSELFTLHPPSRLSIAFNKNSIVNKSWNQKFCQEICFPWVMTVSRNIMLGWFIMVYVKKRLIRWQRPFRIPRQNDKNSRRFKAPSRRWRVEDSTGVCLFICTRSKNSQQLHNFIKCLVSIIETSSIFFKPFVPWGCNKYLQR